MIDLKPNMAMALLENMEVQSPAPILLQIELPKILVLCSA